ncbi:nuclear transport factor 2 [Colletotrichum higginsianum]|nr:nuclear transport factor 2 [Colletotrichum higginsianum]
MADKQFIEFYYNQFDSDRKGLSSLYSLPFQKVKHQVTTLDAQPTLEGGIIILVTGQLLVDEEQRPMNYTQAFQLLRDPSGNYFVFNDIFKLVYG